MKTFLPGMFFCVAFAIGEAQTLVRGPYLQAGTSTSMNVRWRTFTSEASRMRYGLSPGSLTMTVEELTPKTEHDLKISGLTPATQYWYSIETGSTVLQGNADNFFYTLPTPGSTGLYRIAAFGDCGNNSTNQVNVRDALLYYLGSNNLNAWILLGDNAYANGTDQQYSSGFFNLYQDRLLKQIPLYPAPGNHDYGSPTGALPANRNNVPYHRIFSLPVNGEAGGTASGNKAFYSFDIGNVHFLSLDSYGRETAENTRLYDTLGPQVTWVKQDLENNTNKEWIVAYWHHPPYTMGSHNSDTEAELVNIRTNFIKILERYGVDLIVCGHSHVYERTRLMKGHYGLEATFNAADHNLSASNGMYDGTPGSCPYVKKTATGNQGTVYVVSGSAGQRGGEVTGFPHEAMFYSNKIVGGSLLLEVEGNRMDVKWVCADSTIRDSFTMMKETGSNTTYNVDVGQHIQLTASHRGTYNWSSGETTRTISVTPAAEGTTQYMVEDNEECTTDTFNVVASRVLPVTWGDLKCRYNKTINANVLQWEILSQQKNRQFIIERSQNAVLFEPVGTIEVPLNNTAGPQSYTYTDQKIEAGKKYYYRVKQTDLDGKFSYSAVIAAERSAAGNLKVLITPNPASANEVRIRLTEGNAATVQLRLTDAHGKLVYKTSMYLTERLQSFMPPAQQGVYFLSVSAPGYETTRQIVIR
ncbi:MAG: metallophosphoesterase [Agriterribacter sp.]